MPTENELNEYRGMSAEAVEKMVPLQESEPDISEGVSAPTKADATPEVSTTEVPAAKSIESNPIEQRLETLEKLMDSLNRQSSQWKALQSVTDQMKELLATQRPQQNALNPQEQASKSAEEAAEKFLNERIAREAKSLIEREYGSLIAPIREQQLNQVVESKVASLGLDFKEMEPIFKSVIAADAKAAENGDAEAKQRLISWGQGNMDSLVMRGLVERSKTMQEAASKVSKTDSTKGERLVKTNMSSGAPAPKKRLEEMSVDELRAMDSKELENMLPQQRSTASFRG